MSRLTMIKHTARTVSARLSQAVTAGRTARSLAAAHPLDAAELAIYYGGPAGDLYQVRQWLAPFRALHGSHPVVVLAKDAAAARALAAGSPFPVRLAGHADAIEPLVRRWGVRAIFYVNNNLENFSVLRIAGPAHIHLSHGESDKASMASNQLKAYDFCFVAGDASAERIVSRVPRFDPNRLVRIGRPQLDALWERSDAVRPGNRSTVLYAPTWEGDRPAMAYGSVLSHGPALAASVLADPGLRLVYRPHPKTGDRDAAYARADREVRSLVRSAAAADPSAGHAVDLDTDYAPALAGADTAVFDVSAMAMDYMVLGRPFLFARPAPGATLPDSGPWTVAPKLAPEEAPEAAARLREALAEGVGETYADLVEHHFGDASAGAGTRRFVAAVEAVLAG